MPPPARSTTSRSERYRVQPWLVLVVGLVASGFAAWLIEREVQRAEAVRFAQQVERITATINGRFAAAAQAVYGGRALFVHDAMLPHVEWAEYAREMARFFDGGVVALGFMQRIPRSQIEALE